MRYCPLHLTTKRSGVTVRHWPTAYLLQGTATRYELPVHGVDVLKKKGYKVEKEKDGMILMKGDAKNGWSRIVIIPETHPAFNGGMFIDDDENIEENIMGEVEKALIKLIKKAFFS